MSKIDNDLMAKTAAYIERTQPLIDEANEQRSAFTKRATQAAGVLAHHGVIDKRRVNDFIDKVASDPSSVWAFVEKLATAIPVDSLVEAVQTKVAAGSKLDAFELEFFGQPGNSGMFD